VVIGVDIVVRPIEQGHLHIDHLIARHDPADHGLHDPLLDRRNEAARNNAADYGILELESLSPRQWLELDPYMPELAAATRLLLVFILDFIRAAPEDIPYAKKRIIVPTIVA